jgi:hypothetical protein
MADEAHPYIPSMNFETEFSTYDFIYFVQDYSAFLRTYINIKYQNDPDEIGYLTSFIDICDGINTDYGDDGSFEQYRPTLEPLMEWITLWAEDMSAFHDQNIAAPLAGPESIADRTRSKRPATGFEIPPSKRGRNAMTLEPIKQEGVRIKLSDGKEYTYGELKHMWEWNKTMTPYRHPYTEEDKQKIKDFIDFATKGGKRKTRKGKKVKKTKKFRKTKKSRKIRRSRK